MEKYNHIPESDQIEQMMLDADLDFLFEDITDDGDGVLQLTQQGRKVKGYIKTIFNFFLVKIDIRCKVQGCMYGIEGVDKEPKDECMWCGKPRPKGHFFGTNIPELIEELEEYKFKQKQK